MATEAEEFYLPGGPTGIFIVHGYGGSLADYRDIAGRLHRAGHSVFGVRLAGHGIDHHVLAQSHLLDWQRSIADGVATFRKNCLSLIVLAASFGGALAADYMAEHPADVQGLVLVNTPMAYRRSTIQKMALRGLRFLTPYYSKYGLNASEKRLHAERGSTIAWPIDGLFETQRFLDQRLSPALAKIQSPTLVLYNQNDPYVSGNSAQQLYDALGTNDKQIQQIPGQTHRPFRDLSSVQFIATQVLDFVAAVVAKTA